MRDVESNRVYRAQKGGGILELLQRFDRIVAESILRQRERGRWKRRRRDGSRAVRSKGGG